jgi:aminoglycoside phosphotransferase (APT) family kinase protein
VIAIDQPGPVRPGDELDRRALETWLLGHIGDARGPLLVRQFAAGRSNLNYLLDLGGRELVLRRPPPGAALRAGHDVGREYRLLASLHPAWGCVPEPLAYCPDPQVIGAPFLVARRVRGLIVRREVPEGWGEAAFAAFAAAFADTLASLHRVDPQLAGLGDIGRPVSLGQQLEGNLRRYQAARTADSPDLGAVAAWLRRRLPPAQAPALCHNDYKYDNLVLGAQSSSGVAAVLDWELATLADPQLDLAWTLACWVEAGDPAALQSFGLTQLPGNPDRARLLERYAQATQRAVPDPVFLYVFGLLRLASVLQQIYARVRAEGGDARQARVIGLLHDVAEQADSAIRLDRISALR